VNVAFAVFFGIAILNHTAIAEAQAIARADGRRTHWNLERDVRGRWEVVARDEPTGAPRFPGDVVVIAANGEVRFSRYVDPALVESWWQVEGDEEVAVDLPAAGWCWPCRSSRSITFNIQEAPRGWEPPALLVDVLSRNPPALGRSVFSVRWIASVRRAEPQALTLRSGHIWGREEMPSATIDLIRVTKPATGFDFGADVQARRLR
jgi:hypothetical protein